MHLRQTRRIGTRTLGTTAFGGASANSLLSMAERRTLRKCSAFYGTGYKSMFQILTELSLTTNLELCLDAGDADSYSSGQSWLDRSGNGFDFFRGAASSSESTDPTFNGTPGGLSGNEYWSYDGGDFFTYDTSNETWMNNIHKDNAIFTLMAFVYFPDIASDVGSFGTETGIGGQIGFEFRVSSAEKLAIYITNGSAGVLDKTADSALAINTWHMVAVSINEAAGASGGFLYADGSYAQVGAADTWNPAYTSPSASNSGATFSLGNAGTRNWPNGSRQAIAVAWEGSAISKANLDLIWNEAKGRFGL